MDFTNNLINTTRTRCTALPEECFILRPRFAALCMDKPAHGIWLCLDLAITTIYTRPFQSSILCVPTTRILEAGGCGFAYQVFLLQNLGMKWTERGFKQSCEIAPTRNDSYNIRTLVWASALQ
jgi:hypothetical protein